LFKNNDQLLQKFKNTDLTLLCKHGDKFRSKNETSENSHTYRMQCPFIAKLKYDNKQNCLIFLAYNLVHNHLISKEIFESYTIVKTAKLKQNNEEIKLQKNLDPAKATVYKYMQSIANLTTVFCQKIFIISSNHRISISINLKLINYGMKFKKCTKQIFKV